MNTKTIRRPNVLPLSFAAFFNDMGSDIVFALYPIFIYKILSCGEMKILGLIETAALFFGFVLRPLVGSIADMKGRKNFIWFGYLFLVISRIGQGLAQTWQMVIPFKICYEVGRGIRAPARDALVADSVPKEERGMAFGIIRSMDTWGAVIGPLLGLLGFFLFTQYLGISHENTVRAIFILAAFPTLVSSFIIFRYVKEMRDFRESAFPLKEEEHPKQAGQHKEEEHKEEGSPKQAEQRKKKKVIISLPTLWKNKSFFVFTIVSCLFSLWAISENYMILCGIKVLGLEKGDVFKWKDLWIVILLYWLINISFAPTAIWTGMKSDKTGRKKMIAIGFLILAFLTFGFSFVHKIQGIFDLSFWYTFAVVGSLFLLHGVYQGFVDPCASAFVSDMAHEDRRAETLGTYQSLTGIFTIPAPLVFGILWDSFGFEIPCLISAGCIALSFILLVLFVKEEPKRLPDEVRNAI